MAQPLHSESGEGFTLKSEPTGQHDTMVTELSLQPPARGLDIDTGYEEVAMREVNVAEKLSQFSEYWSPRIVGELNGQHVKLAKLLGEFVWHHHDGEDELFIVIKGCLRMRLRGGDVVIDKGEFLIVPRGIEHLPVAEEEVHVLLIEPAGTRNTGNVQNELTVDDLERV